MTLDNSLPAPEDAKKPSGGSERFSIICARSRCSTRPATRGTSSISPWRNRGPSPVKGEGGCEGASEYADVPGFCKSAKLEEVRRHGHVLTPGRYVGAEEAQEEDQEPFEDKMKRLVAELRQQQAEGAKLAAAIEANLKALGFGGDR